MPPRFPFAVVRSLLVLVPFAFAVGAPANASPQEWALQFGSGGGDEVAGMIPDGAGGTFEVGWTTGNLGGPSLGGGDAYLGRRDAAHAVVWQKKLGTAQSDSATAVASDGAGGFFVSGTSDGDLVGPNQGYHDIFIARYDAAGNQMWIVSHGSPLDEEVRGAAPDGMGGCFVAGLTYGSLAGPAAGKADAWVGRFDSSGGLVWWTQLGTSESDRLYFASPDGSGGVLVGGSTEGALAAPSGGPSATWYANFDGAGNLQWIRQFSTTITNFAQAAIPDGSGGLFLSGGTHGPMLGMNTLGAYVLHLDALGNVLWWGSKGEPSDGARCLALDGAGGVYVGGYHYHQVASSKWNQQPFVARYDASGNLVYEQMFGSTTGPGISAYDDIHAMLVDSSGTILAAGFTHGSMFAPIKGSTDAWIARFGSCDQTAFTDYCPGAPNSTGEPADIDHWGSPHVTRNDLVLTVLECPKNQLGMFIMGNQTNNVPFGDGTLCVGGGVKRLLPAVPTASIGGGTLEIDLTDLGSPASLITAGSTWNFQFWYRDSAAGGTGFNLSSGLSVTFCL